MAASPYDPVYVVLNTVRTRFGDDLDSLLPLGGQIGSNSQAYSQSVVNAAWRKLQQFLVSNKYPTLIVSNFVIASLPPVANVDVSLQVTLTWTGYNDGVTAYPSVVLPQNLIMPLKLAERPSDASPNAAAFIDMDGPEQGIVRVPSVPKQQWNQVWVWDTDKIMMPGALAITDLRVDYAAYLADFADTGDVTSATDFVTWFEQPVPIMRALDPLANYILAELEMGRNNGAAAVAYTQAAENGAMTAILGKSTGALN